VAEFWTAFDGVAGILFEDVPFFTKNNTGDEALLLASEERGAQGAAKSASLPCGAVAVNDFDGDDTGLLRLTELVKEAATGFVNRGKASLDVQSFESRHGRTGELCLREESETNCVSGKAQGREK